VNLNGLGSRGGFHLYLLLVEQVGALRFVVSHESFALSTSRKKQKRIVVNDYVWAFGAQRCCARTNSVATRRIVGRAETKSRSYKLGGGT
jgi:hypothetical protein